MNKYTGVIGVYNCQGAAWNAVEKKNTFHQTKSEAITGHIKGRDVHLISDAALDSNWNGSCAVYSHRSGDLVILPHNAAFPVSLKVLEYEIFTITPVKELAPEISFAPLGLLDMYNAGGAILGLKYEVEAGAEVALVSMEVKGCGRFGAYSSANPTKCTVGGKVTLFSYDCDSNLVTLILDDLPAQGQQGHHVIIEFIPQ